MRRVALAGLFLVLLAAGISTAYAAHKSSLGVPSPQGPGNGASVQSFPAVTWGAVTGAALYEYQIAADSRFESVVLGSGAGKGTSRTHSTAAALDQALPDGTYYWRVRAIDAKDSPGSWSLARRIVKKWSAGPRILGPDRTAVTWPSVPLVLRWATVPYATNYLVTIATDPALSNAVVGSATQPLLTQGTVFALPTSLGPGQYYWAITPEDAEGHRGRRSRVAAFTWSWPTSMTSQVANVNPNPQVFDPQFSWSPVPGAAQYEVEVNSAQDFPAGSKWCCTNKTTGTSLSPTQVLGNSTYYWRVRAIDAQGNAGVWNVGTPFSKAFDGTAPTIPNLTMSDVSGNALAGAPVATDSPIVTWSPVPGASRYEVQVGIYSASGCDWSMSNTDTAETATTAWTPLGNPGLNRVGPSAWPAAQYDLLPVRPGTPTTPATYCVRVLARSDDDAKGSQVVSDWTQVGGNGMPAFTYLPPPPAGSPGPGGLVTAASAYIHPATGTMTSRTPLFTWSRVAGASGYYVVISRDAGFTQVADVAFTTVPAYAPRLTNQEPLADETSGYYWAVIPSMGATGSGVFSNPPGQDSPQTFTKSSTAPTPQAPINGATVSAQPTFSWTPAENARSYTLQVSQDPSFGNPIDNVTTDSTAFTSSSTYPADIVLYWRVRASDWSGQGLNWSTTATFRRTLPIPVPAANNPTGGQAIPALSWAPVQGAISYDVHVDQEDGTTRDFTVNSTSFTPILFYGLGVWRWQVRADFPTASVGTVAGGYSPLRTFVRKLAAPAGARGIKVGTRIVLSWHPDLAAKHYQVDVSATNGFSTVIDSHRVDGTTWAPDVDFTQPHNQGKVYWRVAAIDEGNNVGTFASGNFSPARPTVHCTSSKSKNARGKAPTCAAKPSKPKPQSKKKH